MWFVRIADAIVPTVPVVVNGYLDVSRFAERFEWSAVAKLFFHLQVNTARYAELGCANHSLFVVNVQSVEYFGCIVAGF